MSEITKHSRGKDHDQNDSSEKDLDENENICNDELYINPQYWFEEKLSGMNGRVNKQKT